MLSTFFFAFLGSALGSGAVVLYYLNNKDRLNFNNAPIDPGAEPRLKFELLDRIGEKGFPVAASTYIEAAGLNIQELKDGIATDRALQDYIAQVKST